MVMRDLVKHPLTVDELLACLRETSQQINAEQAVGDMRPLLLNVAAMIIISAPEQLKLNILQEFSRPQ